MKYVGYYNGEIGPLEEMKIPMLDRAVYFGDGCYDATTFANNNIFAADDHLDRFYNSCKLLEIPFEMSREELRAELQKCIDANEIDHGMLYWQCSRGTTYRGHQFPPASVKPNLMIFTVPCDLIPFDKTFRLISMEDTRFLHCNIKTLNLLPSVAAVQVSADGQPIVMLADHQTTGGYAKIATVISADLPALAQLRPGQRACFTFVTPSRAVQAARQQAALWQRVRDRL